jgi:uncharacterized zinc-type alcohol dehydrogenase-like protein
MKEADNEHRTEQAAPGSHSRRDFSALGPKDVAIKIHYGAICHSDIHTIHGDWGPVTSGAGILVLAGVVAFAASRVHVRTETGTRRVSGS